MAEGETLYGTQGIRFTMKHILYIIDIYIYIYFAQLRHPQEDTGL